VISGAQIRAARGLLNWSSQELAEQAHVGWSTVKRFEDSDEVPQSRAKTLEKILAVLEASGIEFLGDPLASPGVRLRKP
jgi:ribosome-binding protein aMBF1 (putative translation factor)